MAAGRPSEYKEEYIGMVDHYLADHEDTVTEQGKLQVKLPTIDGFARYINVPRRTLYEWKDKNEGFSHSLDKIVTEQQERLLNMGLSGDYNPTIAKLVLSSNHGFREKTEQDITSAGKPIPLMNNVLTNNQSQEDSSAD